MQTRDIRIDGMNYSISSDDDYLVNQGPDFEPQMVELFKKLIRPNDCVLDIGANIGLTSLLFSDIAASVGSFEPSPTTFAFLRDNIFRAAKKNVLLQNIGLGANNAESEITFAANNRAGGFVSDQTKASAGHVTEKIIVRKLDDVLPDLGMAAIDFIKIDVEGFEKFVIQGAARTLEQHRPVIVLELNHWCLNAFQRITVPDFFDFLMSVFPIVLAVDARHFLDIRDPGQRYATMYRHIVGSQYSNIVCAFDSQRLDRFHADFVNG